MADEEEQEQGGPRASRRTLRKQHAVKPANSTAPQPSNDWSASGGSRPHPSPRSKTQGDIDVDMDIVESSNDEDAKASSPSAARKHRQRKTPPPRRQVPSPTDSDTDTPPLSKTPPRPRQRSANMRAPNSAMPVMNTVAMSRGRQQPIYEEYDDENEPPSRRSRPASRQTASRRDLSSRSAHRYRSTPDSTRRTSLSESDDDTDATQDSVEEVVIRGPTRKVPTVPPAPAPPPPPAANNSMHDRLNRRPEIVYEDPDPEPDMASRYTQSVRHRSPSRAPSTKRDQYRRPRDVSMSRPGSPDEDDRSRSKSRSRLSKRYYESDAYPSRAPSLFKRSNTIAGGGGSSHLASSHSLSSKRSQFFADIAASSVHPGQLEKPAIKTRLTTCIICRDNQRPVHKTAKLKCGHRMCHPCLERNFRLSLTDSQHMPPRCCTTDLIPFKHVEKIVDSGFKNQWMQKYHEFSTRDLICCPEERCGQWIRPDIRRDGGNGRPGQAKCTHCKTKICCACHGRWHPQTNCPRDDGMTEFLEHAKREGYQQCYKCRSMVELKEGCNHVRCLCGAEFCMMCGDPWRSCDCEWFPGPSVRPQRVPQRASGDLRFNPFASISQYGSRPSSPRGVRAGFGHPHERAGGARPRPSSYEEEPYLSRRHQDPRDEHHARRMHSFDAFGYPAEHGDYARRGRGTFEFEDPRPRMQRIEPRGRGASFGEADLRAPRAATVVAPSPPQTHVLHAPPPPRSAFEPPSRPAFDRAAAPRFDYASEFHPPRGMRYASPDRFEEYATEHYTAERRQPPALDRRQTFPHVRRPRSFERRHAYPSEPREESPDSSWEQIPTRFPSPDRLMQIEQSPQSRHMPPPERHMPPPERHMPPPERHMPPPERHMPPPERHMQVPERHMQTPDRHMQVPERHMQVPDRHAAPPEPERRRASSLDRRLADRFNPDARQSPGNFHRNGGMVRAIPPAPLTSVGAPIGHHMGMMGPVGPIGPLSPTRGPPTLSRAASHPHPSAPGMHSGPSIPVAPVPPPAVPGVHTPRRHTLDEDVYVSGRHPGGAPPMPEWFGPAGMVGGMGFQEWDPNGGSPRAPHVRRRPPQAHREHNKQEAKPSVQAGLSGAGRGLHRVSEWVNYIEPGLPDETAEQTVVG